MRILFLGGTQFVGLHMVEAALAKGHEVSLFTRGQTNPDLFPQAEKLIGDRDNNNLDALKNRSWDAVIDVNGYIPRHVAMTTELLSERTDRYVFISTLAVYGLRGVAGQDEKAPLATMPEGADTDTMNWAYYGPLKVLAEKAAETVMPRRVLTIRPGYIVGPHDSTDRFTYWVQRVKKGGEMLAPGIPTNPIQFVDARDLAQWTIHMVEDKHTGIFNVTGPDYMLTWGKMLETAKETLQSDVQFTWVSEDFIQAQSLEKGGQLPLWSPKTSHGQPAFDSHRAIAAGLSYRPLRDTINDTVEWDAKHGTSRAGLIPEREAELLKLWHEQNPAE